MLSSTQHQSWLFYLPLAQQAALLKDDLLEPVDHLLDDPLLVDLVRDCLAGRRPASARNGRPGIAPDRLLRCCVLKHLKGWSFRDLDRELRSNLIYRRFTRFDAEATPTYSAFCRLFAVLSPEATQQIHHRVVGLAREKRAAPGHKMGIGRTRGGGQFGRDGSTGQPVAPLSAFGAESDCANGRTRVGREQSRRGESAEPV